MSASWGTDRRGNVLTVWCTDQRRSLRKIAEAVLNPGETLEPWPRDHDRPERPSRFRIKEVQS